MQKFEKIAITSTGDNIVVAGVSERKIRVLAYTTVADAVTTLTWKSGSTAISGDMTIDTKGGIATSIGQLGTGGQGTFGLMETAEGEDLVLSQSGTATVGGHITYYLV